MHVCLRVRASVRVCMCKCARVCAYHHPRSCAGIEVCVHGCVCMSVRVHVCARERVGARARVCARVRIITPFLPR